METNEGSVLPFLLVAEHNDEYIWREGVFFLIFLRVKHESITRARDLAPDPAQIRPVRGGQWCLLALSTIRHLFGSQGLFSSFPDLPCKPFYLTLHPSTFIHRCTQKYYFRHDTPAHVQVLICHPRPLCSLLYKHPTPCPCIIRS